MPLRGLIGSDVLANRPDWKLIDNPFGETDPIVLCRRSSPILRSSMRRSPIGRAMSGSAGGGS